MNEKGRRQEREKGMKGHYTLKNRKCKSVNRMNKTLGGNSSENEWSHENKDKANWGRR